MTDQDALQGAWQAFVDEAETWPDVAPGRMMSAPALTRHGRVFAFPSRKGAFPGLGLRLGRGALDAAAPPLDAVAWAHLAPFKTKPPMRDWAVVSLDDTDQWPTLARIAHDLLKTS